MSKINVFEFQKTTEAIPILENILKSPSTPESEAKAKTMLGVAYFDSDVPDPIKGARLLKEVSTNENYPKLWRAIALQHLEERATSYGEKFAEENVFTGPYESFYKKEKGGFSVALRKLDEESDSLYPIAVPNYRIAYWYSKQLLMNQLSSFLSENKKNEYLSVLNKRLHKADYIFATVKMSDWDMDRLMLSYFLKAQTLENLYLINPSETLLAQAKEFFEKTMEVYENNFELKKKEYNVPFGYAAFLAEVSGKSESDQIKNLLRPFYTLDEKESQIYKNFLAPIKDPQQAARSFHQRELILLAQIDSDFRNTLKQFGWSDEELNRPQKKLLK